MWGGGEDRKWCRLHSNISERGRGPQQDKSVQEVELQSQTQEVTVTQLFQVGKETHWGAVRRRARLRETGKKSR